MLLGSVVLGVLLLIVSFGYSIRNAISRRDLMEGLLGRNGIAGLLFYLTLLALVLNAASGIRLISNSTGFFVLAALTVLIVMREPLANWIAGRPVSGKEAAGYYIESGFGVFETLLAMFSGTISFIRVGAFALSHVGLSIAVETMAEMTKNAAGSILVYIVGNAIIIGLEGLIVFIQGLRLEYYEMFGKYYRGEGVEFQPAGISRR
jgi:V/A-type H+-transporting ATPase subunit I